MTKWIVLTALTGLLAAGCTSHRGGTYDESQTGYSSTGGPVRGPGTGGMGGPGGTSTDIQSGVDTNNATSTTPDTSSSTDTNTPSTESTTPQ